MNINKERVQGALAICDYLSLHSWRTLFVILSILVMGVGLSGCTGLVSTASTTGNPPPSALDITNVQAASTTTVASQVVWTTNVAADSAVDYGTSTSYGYNTPVNSAMVTSHQVTLSSLAAGTTYYYQVNSTDSKGNLGKSGGHSFKTAGFSISGTISPATGGSAATLTLGGAANATTTADSLGNYTFAGQPNGTYTVVPSHAGFTFTPSSQSTTVNGNSVSGVNFTANAVSVAPTITTQPTNQMVTSGQTATFTVVAAGTAPLAYQWQKNGANIAGATAASYTTPATASSDSGSTFAVVVSNSAGTVTSVAATLTVNATAVAPTITTQPANQTVTAGATATFTVVAGGTAPLSYQWQKNGANIAGATAASYTTPATTTADSGSTFAVVVSNSAGTVTSAAATLTVTAAAVAPTITTPPPNQTVTAGQTATFTVAAGGTAPLSYQWQKNGAGIAGATSSSYTTAATTTTDSGSTFRVVVTNTVGTVTSAAATLTVNAAAVAPTITTQPANQAVTVGQTATFTVVASGTAPLNYQWEQSGANITGASSASYTTPATTSADSGSTFAVVVTNSAGTVTSNSATLTVSPGNQKTYSTTFPLTENPISEGGNWVNGGTTGLDWSNVQTTGGVKAWGTQVPSGPGTNDSITVLTGTWGTNQTGQGISAIQPSATNEIEVILHGTITAHSAQLYEFNCSLGYQEIVKWLGALNSFTVLVHNGSVSCPSGSVLEATAVTNANGSVTLTAFINGVQVNQITDSSSPYTGGSPGIGFWIGSGANNNDAGISSFSAQDNITSSSNSSATVLTPSLQRATVPTSKTTAVSGGMAPDTAPAITNQPANSSVVRGSAATFTAVASGTAPLTYQWQRNGSKISGATAASYTTPATTTSDNDSTFAVVVSNSVGSVTSSAATLTVSPGTQKVYSTSFPLTQDPISEGGNWLNGGTVGLDWSTVQTSSGLAFGTESGSTAFDDSTAVLSGFWTSDQMAQATVYTVNQNDNIHQDVELRLRTTITANGITGYAFKFRCASDASQYVQIVRGDGPLGSSTELGGRTGPGLHDGDVVKVTAVGKTLTAYINGTAIFSVTDSTYSSGSPGIGFYNENGTAVNNTDFGFSNFYASDIVETNSAKSTQRIDATLSAGTSLLTLRPR